MTAISIVSCCQSLQTLNIGQASGISELSLARTDMPTRLAHQHFTQTDKAVVDAPVAVHISVLCACHALHAHQQPLHVYE